MSDDLIKVRFDDRRIRDALQRLEKAASDMSPAFRQIAGVLADATEQAFEDEADPATGRKWEELADVTKAARQKRGHWPGKILQESGNLASAIQSEYDRDHAALIVGGEIEYAAIMQFGGMAGRGRKVEIPARPFLGLGPDDEAEIVDIIEAHIRQALR